MFTIKDSPVENHRKLKIRVIGAGYSGIYLGIRIPQRLRNVDLRIYEKEDQIGGTWWVNKYPGCACDVPSHSYQYSFEPKPDWSSMYAPQHEICAYLQGVAEKFGVTRFVKQQHEVTACTWNATTKQWILDVKDVQSKTTFRDEADVVISARGFFTTPSWPDISGLRTFEGQIMHSASWDTSYDFGDKNIGVIGNGSSAIQIVPELEKIGGTKLSCFVRSKTWITNPFGDSAMLELGLDPTRPKFSDEQRNAFLNDPEKLLAFRKTLERHGNTVHEVAHRDSDLQKMAVTMSTAAMRERLSSKPEIADFLIPSFGVGCRRATPGPGYLEALGRPNVDFITDPIKEVNSKGILLKTGRQIDLDCIVCATGFNTSGVPQFQVHGSNGTTLAQRFSPNSEAYLSLAVDGFPNLFFMLGPNAGVGSGALTIIIESAGDYIIKCIRKLQKEDYSTMNVKKERVSDWVEHCQAYFKKTVYTDQCKSWYKGSGGDGSHIIGLWPGSTLHALEALRSPRWEDFEWESLRNSGNKMRWLGNGYSITHTKSSSDDGQYGGDPAWYIDPMFQDKPLPGRPEDDMRYKMRPFSH
ncbi:hypothetical protein PFICI_08249 [Pestalotiopsis fici W106-1]|uniref:FAD/NAD(P)-binding domain-containing protein n=1 Tax=Pestalotiopsis fici (strain W106-1 / CGMCC3.15140) TaxID=1229662 RepID=W3X3U4_PESFW|nr:uncharacterized protein PFICI_08249 [Pestalotiopsis fici W106-1]ETS80720.1 hypothetical protein PFICI_08249 [Pestalotiopsis fici W106-1]